MKTLKEFLINNKIDFTENTGKDGQIDHLISE